MVSVSVSLGKVIQKKIEIVRAQRYPGLSLDESVREFFKDQINAAVPDSEVGNGGE